MLCYWLFDIIILLRRSFPEIMMNIFYFFRLFFPLFLFPYFYFFHSHSLFFPHLFSRLTPLFSFSSIFLFIFIFIHLSVTLGIYIISFTVSILISSLYLTRSFLFITNFQNVFLSSLIYSSK